MTLLISENAVDLKGASFFLDEDEAEWIAAKIEGADDIMEVYHNIYAGMQGDKIVMATWEDWKAARAGEQVRCWNHEDIMASYGR